MDLFAQVDALHAESDEENSEEEIAVNSGNPFDIDQNRLVVNFDLNYDITGKNSRPELYNDSKDSSAILQFDSRNDDDEADSSYDEEKEEEREHMNMLKQDSDLLDDKDILEL